MSKIELDLPPDLSRFVRSQVEAGLYHSEQDVIEDAVRRLSEADEAKVEAIKAALAPGLAEADAGIYFEGGAAEIIKAAHKRLAQAE